MKKYKFLETYTLLTYLSELLPLVVCLFFFKKIKTNYLKVFCVYLILLAIISFITLYVVKFQYSNIKYFILLRLYITFEYLSLVIFFAQLAKSKIYKKIIILSIIPFWGYCVFNYTISNPNTFNNYPSLVEFSVLILIIIYYFFEKMKIVSKVPLFTSISFWLCVGLFIYFTGNLFFLLFINSTSDKEFIKQMFFIYSCVTITKNIILASAWFANEKVITDADIIQLPQNMKLDDDFTFTNTPNP